MFYYLKRYSRYETVLKLCCEQTHFHDCSLILEIELFLTLLKYQGKGEI